MKRLLVGSAVFLAVGLGTIIWRYDQQPVPAVRLAPANAELFIECPNLARTAERWPATALSHIVDQPSVRRFFGQPWSALPRGYQMIWMHLMKLQPTSAFFCSTDATKRQWLIGLRCASNLRGWQEDAQGLAANFFGGQFFELDPYRKTGLPPAARDPELPAVYGIRCGSWLLFSSDPALARGAFDRRTRARDGLETCAPFQQCQAKVKAGPDVVTFAQGHAAEMMPLPGCPAAGNGKRALIATTSLDGAQIRDQVFTLGNCGNAPAPGLSRKALEVTSLETLFYASTHLVPSRVRKLAQTIADRCAMAATFDQYFDVLTNAGIDPAELDRVLGDLEIVIERDPVTEVIEPVFSITVRDAARVRQCLAQLVKYRFASCTSCAEIEQAPVYLLHAGTNVRPVTLAFGIVDQQLILSGSPASFAETVRRLRVHQVGLDRSDRYRAAVAAVAPATDAFAYLDTKPAFEKVYSTLRPMAILGTAFMPTLAHYVDPLTLPDTDEISRYLTPIVFSRRHLPEGTIDESVGPITAYQAAVLGFGAGMALGLVQSMAD